MVHNRKAIPLLSDFFNFKVKSSIDFIVFVFDLPFVFYFELIIREFVARIHTVFNNSQILVFLRSSIPSGLNRHKV